MLLIISCSKQETKRKLKQQTESEAPDSFNVSFFIENSGSMFGYLNVPQNTFKNQVYELISFIKTSNPIDSFALGFVQQKEYLTFPNATIQEIQKYKDILTSAKFIEFTKYTTTNPNQSDINLMITNCIKQASPSKTLIFVSDIIYSAGYQQDASNFLQEQKTSLYLSLLDYLNKHNTEVGVLILRFTADFQGSYYDKFSRPIQFSKPIKRPYYACIFAHPKHLDTFLKNRLLEKLKQIDPDAEYALFLPPNASETKFKILLKPLKGSFDDSELSNKIIKNPSTAKEGGKSAFAFQVLVDFSQLPFEDSLLTDSTNYKLSNPSYSLKIKKTDPSKPAHQGYSHLLTLETSNPISETLTIQLNSPFPEWIEKYTSLDDAKILQDPNEQLKTFGLKYLIEGIYDSIYKQNNRSIANLSIQIQK